MAGKQYILVIDEGTTGTKAFVFDRQLKIVSHSYRELALISTGPGCAEMDGNEIFDQSIQCCKEAISKAGLGVADIACLGITTQRSTMIGWDRKSGQPLYNAITWQDSRGAYLKEQIARDGILDLIRAHHGKNHATHGVFPIRWMADHVPGFRQKLNNGDAYFGGIDSWMVNRLTGGKNHYSSFDHATLSCMISAADFKVSRELFDYLDLPTDALPTALENTAFYGVTEKALFGEEIPIVCVIADQHAALFAQRVKQKGDCKCTNGTGSFFDIHVGHEYIQPSHTHSILLAWKIGNEPTYVAETYILTSGTFLRWLKNNLELVQTYEEIDRLAASVQNSAGVVVLPTLYGMTYPQNDTSLQAAIMGITQQVQKAHVLRGALEGISYMIRYAAEAVLKNLKLSLNNVKIDGGVAKSDIFCEILATVMNRKLLRPHHVELTALGTAELAGLQMGFWDEAQLDAIYESTSFWPDEKKNTAYNEFFGKWQSALERSMNWPS